MFKELTISNFRGIEHLKVEGFSKLNLVVGANNSGKTTVLESLFLLTGISNSTLPLTINSLRFFSSVADISWKSFFRDLKVETPIVLDAKFSDNTKRQLKISPHTSTTRAIKDNKGIDISSSTIPEINGLVLEASISNGNKQEFTSGVWVDLEGKEPHLVTSAIKDYKELRKGVFLSSRTGSDMSNRFDNIQRRKEKDKVIAILKNIEPNLTDIALGQEGIIYVDLGLDNLIPVQLIGDGMIKILSIVLAIMDTQEGVVLIDEVENGLHFKSQEILWNAIAKTSEEYNVQVIATTHSIESIKAFSNVLEGNISGSLFRIEADKEKHESIYFPQDKIKSFIESNWEIR
jgi:AAA15 family ATPase/GTPase